MNELLMAMIMKRIEILTSEIETEVMENSENMGNINKMDDPAGRVLQRVNEIKNWFQAINN